MKTFILFYLLARGCAAACSGQNIYFILFVGARLRRGVLRRKHLLLFHLLARGCAAARSDETFTLFYLLARGRAATRPDKNIYLTLFVGERPRRGALG